MKSVKQTLLERRSIRRYEREHIPAEAMDFIFEAIRNTPTSYNGQQFSVIDVSDQSTKEQIEQMLGQKQVKTCDRFLVFCIDFHKIAILADRKDLKVPPFASTADGYTVGVVDASLAMMSAVAAAESLGLGTCPIGYARTAAPQELSTLLGLPKDVMIVCALALGIPRELPDFKPKQPRELVIHQERYSDDERLLPLLEEYDAQITTYNATRAGETTNNDWCGHILGYYAEGASKSLLPAMRRQGFDLKS